jgi:hypothetical protein
VFLIVAVDASGRTQSGMVQGYSMDGVIDLHAGFDGCMALAWFCMSPRPYDSEHVYRMALMWAILRCIYK